MTPIRRPPLRQQALHQPASVLGHERGRTLTIAEQLNLTDDQKPKVQAILEAQRKKMRDLRQDTSLSP